MIHPKKMDLMLFVAPITAGVCWAIIVFPL